MSIHAHIVVDARGVDVTIDIDEGQTVALLGPNGAGKSTVLGALAGVITPDRGRISVNGDVLFDAERGILVPPHRRRIALLAQEPLLFPHLTVRDNVAFGPRSRGATVRAARAVADARLAEVGASALASARPTRLSGGQGRRVAVARALATDPMALLLDEPLVALDVAGRDELRRLLADALGPRTGVVVTHDPMDALILADRAVVIEGGRIVDDAPVADLLAEPRTAFEASLADVSLVAGRVCTAPVRGILSADGRVIPGDAGDLPHGAAALAAIPPEAIIMRADPTGDARVTRLDLAGGRLRVAAGDLVGTSDAATGLAAFAPGAPVRFDIDAQRVRIYAPTRAVS